MGKRLSFNVVITFCQLLCISCCDGTAPGIKSSVYNTLAFGRLDSLDVVAGALPSSLSVTVVQSEKLEFSSLVIRLVIVTKYLSFGNCEQFLSPHPHHHATSTPIDNMR